MKSETPPVIRLKDYRKPDYTVREVDLTFQLQAEETLVTAKLTVERGRDVDAGTPLFFDGDELELVSLAIDNERLEPADYIETADGLTVPNPPRRRRFTMQVSTRINPAANTKLMGLYRSGSIYCTQCEAEGFRRITYFPDRPDVLAVYTTRIEADRDAAPVLLSNGNPVRRGKLANGRHFATWHDPHPKPSYLFALVAGKLGSIERPFKTRSGGKVKLAIHVEPGKEPQAEYAMDALVRSMKWDEDVFGCEYDLDVFNIVAVPDFNMGAMENKGLNVFNDKYVLADPDTATDMDYEHIEAIIAHEYFHNWTGNRITCRDWFQLCLKEGLTVYRDQEFSADMRSRAVARIGDVRALRAAQFGEDAGPLAHPVRPGTYREINNFYTATVYQKGAEVVRMIATIVGPKAFAKGMARYLKRHDGEAATVEQFVKCFEEAGKADLAQFFRWYTQAGTPVVKLAADFDKASGRLTVDVEQSLAPTPGQADKKRMHIPLRIGLVGGGGRELEPAKMAGAERVGDLVHITRGRHKLVYSGLGERPVLSVNRSFAAPVHIDMKRSKADLAFLAAHDGDLFCRWEAFNAYATQLLVAGARRATRGVAMAQDERFAQSAVAIAVDEGLEPAFRALALALPGEADLAQAIGKSVDPDAIHRARNALMATMGAALEPVRADLTARLAIDEPYRPDAEQAGKRALANLLLDLAVAAGVKDAQRQSLRQFKRAGNMNDTFAALRRIVHLHGSRQHREQAVAAFYRAHRDNALVLDKWFAVQAAAPGKGAWKGVKQLMGHEQFTSTNPNRVRSLLGTFAFANPTGFHAASGHGYRLVAGAVGDLDALNPQVAARLLTAFRAYKTLEPGRRERAEHWLRQLGKRSSLSADVGDILSRTLDG